MKPRVLILDDNEEILLLVKEALKNEPYTLVYCNRGIDAIIHIFEGYRDDEPFDVVILDCALPVWDGFSVGSVIRHAEETGATQKRARIALLTAYPKTLKRSNWEERLKIDDKLEKPFDHQQLRDLTARLVSLAVQKG